MCGIFGVVATPASKLSAADMAALAAELFRLSESRGKEASGCAIRAGGQLYVHREPVAPREMLRAERYRELIATALEPTTAAEPYTARATVTTATAAAPATSATLPLAKAAADADAAAAPRRPALPRLTSSPALPEPLAILGHARLATNGAEGIDGNNQPVVRDGVVGVHNGIVVNIDELWRANAALGRRWDVDTEVLLALVRAHYQQNGSPTAALRATYRQMVGSASLGLLLSDLEALLLATNTGSLYTCRGQGLVVFASEAMILNRLVSGSPPRWPLEAKSIAQLRPGTGMMVRLGDLECETFSLEDESAPADRSPDGRFHVARRTAAVQIVDSLQSAEAARQSLVRCTRCVLPETMPFIAFDAEGVCNYCRHHEPIRYRGPAALEDTVGAYRRPGDEADAIVAFSGGRDSSYALDYVVRHLRLKPLAYTYDWGMVNALARRNQARLIGKLGIEHVIISADIRRKRRYIKRNIEAWLRRPHLGMIPLFMAGDKQFFYYANQLRRQTGIALSIWAFNRLERTGFKTGFAGVAGGNVGGSTWQLAAADRLRLAGYYLGQFVRNPAYWNRSLADSAFAFASYYLLPHDYLWFHDYIVWDEAEIDRTLAEEYDWETASDSESTWRIGDGTAAFYNYIYYIVAGFTEHDTFRSNQIREGLISRDEALGRLRVDNQPRYESIREYTQIVGVDFHEALKVINRMPKYYHEPSWAELRDRAARTVAPSAAAVETREAA